MIGSNTTIAGGDRCTKKDRASKAAEDLPI
jgi:hypothetical protein